jgi:hypothetical protein
MSVTSPRKLDMPKATNTLSFETKQQRLKDSKRSGADETRYRTEILAALQVFCNHFRALISFLSYSINLEVLLDDAKRWCLLACIVVICAMSLC